MGFGEVVIVGGGLIGASVSLAVGANLDHARLTLVESDPAVREKLLAKQAADVVTDDLAAAVARADLVVLATPVSSFASIANRIEASLPTDAIVTDVASVKACVLRDLAPLMRRGFAIVPAHPLAGSHHIGPDHASAELFRGKCCVLTPPPSTADEAIGRIAAFWRALGMNVDLMDASLHDRVLAVTSHLPHLIASATVRCANAAEAGLGIPVLRYAASGFRDVTRIAAANPALWREIFLENRTAVLNMTDVLESALKEIKDALRSKDAAAIEAFLARAQRARLSMAA